MTFKTSFQYIANPIEYQVVFLEIFVCLKFVSELLIVNELEGYEYGCLSLTQTRPFSSLKNVTILAFRGDFLSPQRNCDFETCMLQSVKWRFFSSLKIVSIFRRFSQSTKNLWRWNISLCPSYCDISNEPLIVSEFSLLIET